MKPTIILGALNDKKIPELYAFLHQDKNGNQGICAKMLDGAMIPMITGDKKNIPLLKKLITLELLPFAPYEIILVQYGNPRILEVLKK